MISRIIAVVAAVVFVLSFEASAQFLPNYAQFDNGVNLGFFLQSDINHDGHADVVGIRGTEITVLLGDGKGGFGSPINSPITGMDHIVTTQIVLGDFNNDGNPDVVVLGDDHITGAPVVTVMLGNGNGTFQAPKETALVYGIPGQNGPTDVNVVSGDFNADGKLDLAYFGGPGIVILPGKGDGTFTAPITTKAAGNFLIGVGNFNSDKNLDLVGVGPRGSASVFLGKGDGTFEPAITSSVSGTFPVVVADLNGDGFGDLLVGEGGKQGVSVMLSDGAGHFSSSNSYFAPANAVFSIQDLNGDGHPDVAILGFNTGSIVVLLNNGDGSFTQGKTYVTDGVPAGAGLLVADLNGDGKLDFAFGNRAGGISVLPGNGNGIFKGNFLGVAFDGNAPRFRDIRLGDFNGDGKEDLLVLPAAQVLLGNGDATFTAKGTCGTAFMSLGSAALRDFNGDGKLDVAGIPTLTAPPRGIQVCLGNGDGTFTTGTEFDQEIEHNLVVGGDFNNDGKFDLAASDQNGVSIFLGNGDGTFQPGIATAVSASLPTFAVADFNNDGKLDIAALISSGVEVLLGKGDGTFEAPVFSPGPKNGFLTVADLNKDGKRDLVVTTAGSAIVLLGKGNGTFAAPVHYALSGYPSTEAVVADLNGDGKLDIAVGSGGVNTAGVNVLFGNGLGGFSAPTVFRTGFMPLGIATADFNLDHKPDVAVNLSGGIGVVTLLHQ